jgi:hypothetical protein
MHTCSNKNRWGKVMKCHEIKLFQSWNQVILVDFRTFVDFCGLR